MQLASQSEHPSRVASQQLRRRRNSQVLLIGFSDAISESIAEQLVGLGLEPHVCGEPFDGLAALIEDPGAWMSCIMDVGAFANHGAFQRYLQLFAFEGQAIGMILGNAGADTLACHPAITNVGIDQVVQDICDPKQFSEAIQLVLARRGFDASQEDNTAPSAAIQTPQPANWSTQCIRKPG